MITRNMADDLQKQIEELTSLLNQQRGRISSLEEASQQVAQPPLRVAHPFDRTRIPDAIKIIPAYNGEPKELPAWLESVENKLTFAKKLAPESELNHVLPL